MIDDSTSSVVYVVLLLYDGVEFRAMSDVAGLFCHACLLNRCMSYAFSRFGSEDIRNNCKKKSRKQVEFIKG